jgi:hypothetical protein
MSSGFPGDRMVVPVISSSSPERYTPPGANTTGPAAGPPAGVGVTVIRTDAGAEVMVGTGLSGILPASFSSIHPDRRTIPTSAAATRTRLIVTKPAWTRIHINLEAAEYAINRTLDTMILQY